MNRRSVLRAAGLAWATALLLAGGVAAQTDESGEDEAAWTEPVTVERLSDYLNGLSTAWARFTQINSDGTLSHGTLVVKRPWRARLEYDPPDTGLVVAGSRRIAIFDRKSNAGPQIFPLSRTPLYLILRETIDLTDPQLDPRFMTGIDHSELHLKSQSEDYSGSLILSFGNDPLELEGWTVVDEFGNRTHVRFDALGTSIDPGPAMFDIDREIARQEGGG